MSDFTKGPWKKLYTLSESTARPLLRVSAADERGRICAVSTRPEAEANALLIAAAPDLYEAAIDFLHGYCEEPSDVFRGRRSDLAYRFRMATNKAEGK